MTVSRQPLGSGGSGNFCRKCRILGHFVAGRCDFGRHYATPMRHLCDTYATLMRHYATLMRHFPTGLQESCGLVCGERRLCHGDTLAQRFGVVKGCLNQDFQDWEAPTPPTNLGQVRITAVGGRPWVDHLQIAEGLGSRSWRQLAASEGDKSSHQFAPNLGVGSGRSSLDDRGHGPGPSGSAGWPLCAMSHAVCRRVAGALSTDGYVPNLTSATGSL